VSTILLLLATMVTSVHFGAVTGVIVWLVGCALLITIEDQAMKTREVLRSLLRELRKDRR
jgi:hypothetical protein